MRALGWLALMGFVSALAYGALCLSAPFKAEAHFIEWLTPEEEVVLHWAMSTWPPQDWMPTEALTGEEWGSVAVYGDSMQCPLTTTGSGVGSRSLWIAQGPEGHKLQEHLSWSVPFYLRGWERLRGQASKPAPMGGLVLEQVALRALQPTAQIQWEGGAFVAVSKPFDADALMLEEPDSLGGDSVALWCCSMPTHQGRKWQWVKGVEHTYLDSVLAAGGKGWSSGSDTLEVWEALSDANAGRTLLNLLERPVQTQDSLVSIWAFRQDNRQKRPENRTAPGSETATLFHFKRARISGQ